MTACLHAHTSTHLRSICGILGAVLTSSVVVVAVLLFSFAQRGRVSPAELADIDPRILGPDVLGERMVVPPNIPDWVFMECESKNQVDEKPSIINRVRQSICHRG